MGKDLGRSSTAGPGPDRRTFLRLAALGVMAGPGALARPDGPAGRDARQPSPAATGDLDHAIIVNALGGLDDPNAELAAPPPGGAAAGGRIVIGPRAIRDAHASGLTAVNVTLGYVAGPEEPFEYTVRTIGEWDRAVREHAADLLRVHTAGDIRRARQEGRIGVIYGFQNGAAIGDKPDRVETFGNLGVRVIQLTYNPRNQLGDGSMVAENRGLTALGREVVARLNEQRIMIDLSHSGENTCLEAARLSRQPVSINHTGCRALVDLPRNKTDQELGQVAAQGGFVGIYFMPFVSPSGHAVAADVVAHVEHAIDICGEDHVGIGTDGSVTAIDDLEAYKVQLAKEVAARAAAGIGAKGERADTYPFVVDLRGVDQFRQLARLLRQRGHSPARIEKILGSNFLRFAETVWGS
jgi:membrane dipeptidase